MEGSLKGVYRDNIGTLWVYTCKKQEDKPDKPSSGGGKDKKMSTEEGTEVY